ncbi:MAG TPA: lipid-binding SYLF domain-containing protein [Bryobacteraceae bacterium]|nr:lipid-binding SYLF domain-containing protein [Bryobacteraceae bacterium]
MRLLTITLAIAAACAPLLAKTEKSKTNERLDDSASLFSEVMGTPDKAIPQNLLDKAYCIVLVPGLKKGGFVFAGKYGRGFALCRHANTNGWGAPAAIRIEGGSFGLQIGVSSSDVILLVMNERGMKRLTTSKFTIGGEATAAAGPVGRDATAQTDALLTAEILSWSRSRGLFAGISLDGSTLRNDIDENEAMYGQRWDNKQILMSGAKPPAGAAKLIAELNKYSPRETH